MNENLQRRIQNLMGNVSMPMQMQIGGEVEQPMPEMMPPQADNSMLESAINELMMARDTAEDPFEAEKAQQLAEATALSAEAPLATIAQEVMSAGRGDDTTLAHLQPGEVVLPPEMFDDPQFEMAVESRFNELDLDPERYVVGMGIASLNPSTGLEEFGFFKKVGKFFIKIVKPVANVAQFVPGPWQAPAALISKASTVVDVARGKANPLSLAGVFGPGATGGTFGENIAKIRGAGDGKFLKGLGSLFSGESLREGFGNIGSGISSLFGGGAGAAEYTIQPGDTLSDIAKAQNTTVEALMRANNITNPDLIMAGAKILVPGSGAGSNILGNLISGTGADDTGRFGYLGDALAGVFGQGGQQGQGFGLGNLGGLGGLGIAGLLGKLAYDEAKNRRGVPLTPMTQMDAMGRFNIEAEIARRMGQDAPNPVEFGLMPANTIPQLSGGRPEEPVGMQAGGSVSSVPEGMKEFFLTTHISDMTVGQQDMLRDLINNDPVFAEVYYQSDDLRMPEAFDVVTNVIDEFPRLNSVTRKGIVSLAKRAKAKNRGMIGDAELNKFMKSRTGQGLSDVEKSLIINQVKEMRNMYMGGPVMAFAEGGNVSEEDFKRKTGKINGPGTETSDEIPAMLSDGEFVFKSQSVRGAGAFDMNKKRGGIIELVPNKEESRERGTDLMYEMMDLFSSYAKKRA